MNVSSNELKDRALADLKGNWGSAIAATLIVSVIMGIAQQVPVIGQLASLILSGAFALGTAMFMLNFARGRRPDVSEIFEGFKNFGTALGTYVLMVLIVFGFTLLLIVPGVIRGIAYSQVFFLLTKEPELSPLEALKKSREMMDGHKMDYFLLCLSFIGWILLSTLTLFIGLIWVIPYMRVTLAHFHREISNDEADGISSVESDILDDNF